MKKVPERLPQSRPERFRPLRSHTQERALRQLDEKTQELYAQWKAKREERTGSRAPVTRTEKAIAIGAIAAVAAGVLVYAVPKVADDVSNIVKDAGYSQLDFDKGTGIFGELKDAGELGNDMQSGTVDPNDLTGLLTNDSMGSTESRSLTSTPTSLPDSLPVPETKQS